MLAAPPPHNWPFGSKYLNNRSRFKGPADGLGVVHSSGVEYLVAGHSDRKQGRLLVNMKSFVKPWKASLGRKVLTLLKKDCNW